MSDVYLIGGPNGSGKTTVAKKLLPNFLGVIEYVNADEIAAGLSPFNPLNTNPDKNQKPSLFAPLMPQTKQNQAPKASKSLQPIQLRPISGDSSNYPLQREIENRSRTANLNNSPNLNPGGSPIARLCREAGTTRSGDNWRCVPLRERPVTRCESAVQYSRPWRE